jgi:sulfur relay (sulfurtransferase) DsrF/TusC family protein
LRIVLSNHAKDKIKILIEHGFHLAEKQVVEAVLKPDKIMKGEKGRYVCQRSLNERHVLKVI